VPPQPFLLPAGPKASYLTHQEKIDQAIRKVLHGGAYILGEEVNAFEQEFAAFLSASHAVGVGSGTEALHLALRACGVGTGDVVITVSHTAVATVAAIELAGATALLVDIDPSTFTIDIDRLRIAIEQNRASGKGRLKAIIPVHLYGHPADMVAIMALAKRHELYVIEDCAQCHGALLMGRMTGTWGDIGAFSFYPTKNLGALGDGGALVTSDPELADRARLLRQYGWRDRQISELAGMNSRLDEIQAAVLRVKLRYLVAENARRREIAQIYDTCLFATRLKLPLSRSDTSHVYHQYVVRSGGRDELRHFLKDNNIDTQVHYPVPVHLQHAYKNRIGVDHGGLVHTERICREILSLPAHPYLSDAQVMRIADLIVRWDSAQGSEV
jgi:dTDP-4-amino-4,6-dideoxygalactose transaminase